MLTGPVTILNWSFPREDISIKDSTLQIALAIKDEVLDLEAAAWRSSKSTRLLFVKIATPVVVTGTKITLTGRLQPSVWYTQLLHQTPKSTLTCVLRITDIIPAIDNLWMQTSHLKLAVQTLKSWMSWKPKTSNRSWTGVYDIPHRYSGDVSIWCLACASNSWILTR